MDDLAITDERLVVALRDLRLVSRWLGGERVSLDAVASVVPEGAVGRILDVGVGGGDTASALVRWGEHGGRYVLVEGVDLNPATLDVAAHWLDRTLPHDLRERITLREADAFALPYADGTFDVAHAALFLHHFDAHDAPRILAEMARVARLVVINDLHRHPVAYHAILRIARLSQSAMFRHDAPMSVLRGFSATELDAAVAEAGLVGVRRWRWAFRWQLVAHRP